MTTRHLQPGLQRVRGGLPQPASGDRLRHEAYLITLEGESYRSPRFFSQKPEVEKNGNIGQIITPDRGPKSLSESGSIRAISNRN